MTMLIKIAQGRGWHATFVLSVLCFHGFISGVVSAASPGGRQPRTVAEIRAANAAAAALVSDVECRHESGDGVQVVGLVDMSSTEIKSWVDEVQRLTPDVIIKEQDFSSKVPSNVEEVLLYTDQEKLALMGFLRDFIKAVESDPRSRVLMAHASWQHDYIKLIDALDAMMVRCGYTQLSRFMAYRLETFCASTRCFLANYSVANRYPTYKKPDLSGRCS